MKSFTIHTTTVISLLSTNWFRLVKAENIIAIGSYNSSAFEVVDPAGTSTFTVTYNVDGAIMGNNAAAGTDFYIKQQMRAKDCGVPYTGDAPMTLATDPDATSNYLMATSTFTNTATWEPGTYEFCMLYTLYMLGPATPFEWQVKGFNIKVDAPIIDDDTFTTTTVNATSVELVANIVEILNNEVFPKNGVAPELGSFNISGGDGDFAYGENVEITWLYVHPLDYFDYNVATGSILPIDPADNLQFEYPAGKAVTFTDRGGSVEYK